MTWLSRLALGLTIVISLRAGPPLSIEQELNQLRKSPPELYAFLLRMPKGGDLHNHVGGAFYAESLVHASEESGLCVATDKQDWDVIAKCETPSQVTAKTADHDNPTLNALIDSFSMRNFVAGRESAHDHFFNAFSRFTLADKGHGGELIAELVRRAADQNESYLELMAASGGGAISKLGIATGLEQGFEKTAESLQAAGLPALVAAVKEDLDNIEKQRRVFLHCDTDPSSAACKVVVRYVFQVLREAPKEGVFAQTLAGFQLAATEPRVVALNFVQAEDGINSMHDYHLHMQMVDFAKKLYPNVHVTLHAGELTLGLVPPEGLRFHIREAVELGHAERIGHGVDIMYETDAVGLLREMRAKHVAVEVNLTSNDLILGVKGMEHPFPVYRKYGVPVVLSTDDEGINRSHLTQEYLRAVLTYGLTYADLKQIVRNSLEYSFLSGASYWSDSTYRTPVKACAAGLAGKSCEAFLAASDKASVQADLEKRFREFEAATIRK